MGFDVHKLVEGRDLWLGGIKIDHSMGLLGHSDAEDYRETCRGIDWRKGLSCGQY